MTKAKHLDILGEKYPVKHLGLEENGYWCPDKTLEISEELEGQKYLEVLIHEGLHGTIYESGMHHDISISQEHCFIEPAIKFLFKNFDIKLKKIRT